MTTCMNFIKCHFLVVILGFLFLCSCSSKKEVLYFNDIDSNNLDKNIFTAGKIQTNDILSIIVSSSSSELSAVYNLNQDQNQNSKAFPGYLVNTEGTITLPIIGKLAVKGLSLSELEDLLVEKLKDGNHLTAPIVTARLMNAKFTVLGEVNKPGTYTFSEQNISLLQAIGYAGDLTINGKRENVLLIREENNAKTYITIDMTSKNWFGSPNYYIKPNDVIYVNPNGPKVKSAGYIGNLGTFINVASVSLSLVLTVILLSK
jgi:polysaccharide export outer membrane protein